MTVHRMVRIGGRDVYEHIVIAETALGRPLPHGTEVHHVDENPRNNVNSNLVICQDRAFHKLLHARARIVRAGGNPDTQRVCSRCREIKDLDQFNRNSRAQSGVQTACRPCSKLYWSERSEKGAAA